MELIQDLTRGLLTVNKYLFNYAIKYVRDQMRTNTPKSTERQSTDYDVNDNYDDREDFYGYDYDGDGYDYDGDGYDNWEDFYEDWEDFYAYDNDNDYDDNENYYI